jgi:eukaryotic-like serine/threonine-protein kinase
MQSPQTDLEIGALFAGRYKIVRVLGSGGMGEVYLVKDALLGEDEFIALKVLHQQLSKDERQSKRFLREVQLTRKVTHPHIIRTFDAGEFGGRLYFTMEYVEGVSLKERMNGEPLSLEETCRIVTHICEGLGAIHEAGIVHRDLKPANVMLLKDGGVKIADFGVARPRWSELTGENEVVGSAPFMAPEVWLGKEIGPAADLYAVGALAYEMVTGVQATSIRW